MTAIARARALPMWRSFAVRDFRLLWASEAVSLIGDQFHVIALAWLVIDLTQSGLALGTVLIAVGVPRALLLVPFGVLADRRPSRTLMLVAHVTRGVIVGAIAVLVLGGQATLPMLAVLGALFGAADALYLPAQQAFLPRTLEAERLPSANALINGTMQLTSIVGPPLAGAVIAVVGTGPAFVVDAASFFAAALVVTLISAPGAATLTAPGAARASGAPAPAGPAQPHAAPDPAEATTPGGQSFLAAIREGVAYVLADPALRTTLLISLVLNFALNGPAAVGMPWLAEIRYGAGPAGLGLMTAAWASGALLGTVLAGNARLERQGAVLLAAVAIGGAAMLVVGLSPWVLGTAAALAVLGVTIGYANIVAVSWLQARVAREMVGRVMSLAMLMGFGITPLSLGIAGWLLDTNAGVLFLGSGVLVILTAGVSAAIRFPARFDAPRTPAGSA